MNHPTLPPLLPQYDAFLVDLWGVIHDGESLYDGVKECLEELKRQGKKVIFLSNAPKRATIAREGLRRLGIPDSLYEHIITSGEVTYDYITSNNHKLGRCYHLINEQEADLLAGSTYLPTSLEEADFIVAIGFKTEESTLEELMPELEFGLHHALPMVCANPDLLIVSKAGVPWLCAGVMAEKYAELGGKVISFGKPYHHVYDRAFSLLPGIPKSRIAAIGDNLNTDIKGGNAAGIDTYLIGGGIHGKELGVTHGELPSMQQLKALCAEYKVAAPTGTLKGFLLE